MRSRSSLSSSSTCCHPTAPCKLVDGHVIDFFVSAWQFFSSPPQVNSSSFTVSQILPRYLSKLERIFYETTTRTSAVVDLHKARETKNQFALPIFRRQQPQDAASSAGRPWTNVKLTSSQVENETLGEDEEVFTREDVPIAKHYSLRKASSKTGLEVDTSNDTAHGINTKPQRGESKLERPFKTSSLERLSAETPVPSHLGGSR